jgi:hypothetical protein
VALDWLLTNGWTISRAVKSEAWPGNATLEIAKVWVRYGPWSGSAVFNGHQVAKVTAALDEGSRIDGPGYRLSAEKRSFIGSALNTEKFILSPQEAERLLGADPRNADVVMPYLNGEDLNSRPDGSATRWVVSFRDWSRERSESYPECFDLIRERVEGEVRAKVEQAKRTGSKSYGGWDDRWWQFWNTRAHLYAAIAELQRVLIIARISKTVQPVFVPNRSVFNEKTVVFAYDDDFHFGLLSSAFHYWWAITHSSSLRTDLNYAPTDVFETFPQPAVSEAVETAGAELDAHRRQLMLGKNEGLTKTYNRVHGPKDEDPEIARLRELHVALNLAVRDTYGWSDLDLDHGFHETAQGVRYTIGPAARTEVLDRLLELNHERHAAELAAGSRAKTKRTVPKRRATSATGTDAEPTLFGSLFADEPSGDDA